jgi:hypothetical protein
MVKDKTIRLIKALSNESVKRLPYIIIIGLILVFAQFVRLNNQTAEGVMVAKNNSIGNQLLLKKIAEQAVQIAELSKENKASSQKNTSISKENSAHIDCVAKLFAQYTRDLKPVDDVNLDNCFIVETSQAVSQTTATPVKSAFQSSSTNPSVPVSSSSSHNTPTNSQPQSNNSQRVRDLLKKLGL